MRSLKTIRSILKMLSLTAYFLIFLEGMLISLPFFFWLIGSVLDFGSTNQFFSLLGIAGVAGLLIISREETDWKKLLAEVLCFLAMAAPLVWRMSAEPISSFNYWQFLVPASIFGISFILAILISCFIYFREKKPVTD